MPAQQSVEQLSYDGGPSSHVPSLKIPAVSSSVDLSDIPEGTLGEWLYKHTMMTCSMSTMISLTDIDTLASLMEALAKVAYKWKHLGDQLGLKFWELETIDRSERGIPMDCMRTMLAAWLQGSGGVCSKQTLKTALQKNRVLLLN